MTKSTITREQLEEWVAQFDEDGGCDATDRQLEALIRQSLAAMDSEPVKRVNADQMHHVCLEANRHLDKYGAMAKEVNKLLGRIPAQPAQVVPENCVTAEHRRVIEMLLNVCGAAFELADDSCQQDVDGEDCHVVPDDAFQKLSDALDEIENTLPTEDIDRPDVFLAWSAIPKAALKSLLQAGNSPVTGIDLASGPDRTVEVRYVSPPGYVMVPKEPTEAMMLHNSGCQHHAWDDPDCAMRQTRRLIWSHMLAAAPQEVK